MEIGKEVVSSVSVTGVTTVVASTMVATNTSADVTHFLNNLFTLDGPCRSSSSVSISVKMGIPAPRESAI